MKSIALTISMFLLSTNVFAEKFSALVQCQFEGPIHEAVFVLPTNISDWTCKDVNAGNSEFVTSVTPTIEINGTLYTGDTTYLNYYMCNTHDDFVPEALVFKSSTGFPVQLYTKSVEIDFNKITYENRLNFGNAIEKCYFIRK